jgi:hypothetical protein
MSKIQVDTIVDKDDTGAPDFPFGATVTGITTGHAIFSFTGINTIGSASTTANYEVFGIVSGGFF